MRVVTTTYREGLEVYGHRWLDSMKHWPAGTEFHFYTEGFPQPAGTVGKDFEQMREFAEWKAKHAFYRPPDWRFDVVKFAHKVFAACDALYDYTGIGVWCDADVVTYKDVPDGLLEKQVEGAYIAAYQRTGMYTETGFWIMDCSHPEHKAFLDAWRGIYLSGRFRNLAQWHDCMAFDATVREFTKDKRISVRSLSGEHAKDMHPQAKSELGAYFDHCKGSRKEVGSSPENKHRVAA